MSERTVPLLDVPTLFAAWKRGYENPAEFEPYNVNILKVDPKTFASFKNQALDAISTSDVPEYDDDTDEIELIPFTLDEQEEPNPVPSDV